MKYNCGVGYDLLYQYDIIYRYRIEDDIWWYKDVTIGISILPLHYHTILPWPKIAFLEYLSKFNEYLSIPDVSSTQGQLLFNTKALVQHKCINSTKMCWPDVCFVLSWHICGELTLFEGWKGMAIVCWTDVLN